jgi:SAM-dependent methyltransferase
LAALDRSREDTEGTFRSRYVGCPVCVTPDIAFSHRLDAHGLSLRWDRCANCRLVFQNPPLTPAALRRLYRETAYFDGEAYREYTTLDERRIAQSRRRLTLLERYSGVPGGRLLDVGSASGFFGVVARERGYAVTCIEPDEALAQYGREHYGLDMRASTLEACALDDESFDVVTLWGTDSHFPDPLAAFRRMAAALRPGGVLAMNYQDFDHAIRRIQPSIKVRWNVMYNLSDHSFDVMMRMAGLRVVKRLRTEWQQTTVGHVCRHLGLPVVAAMERVPILVPAVSFRWVLARKD